MQDLIYSVSNKSEILQTLINLIKLSANSVHEHNPQNSVLPFLNQRQEPVIIVLVMKLFDECEMTKLRNFYQQIAQKVFNILTMDSMMYPELLSSALQLIASITMQYNLRKFIVQTGLLNFFKDIAEQVAEIEDIYQDITNCIYCLTRALEEQKNEDPSSFINENIDNGNDQNNLMEEFFEEEEEEVVKMSTNNKKKVSQFNAPIGKVANSNLNQQNRMPLRSTITDNKTHLNNDDDDDFDNDTNDIMKNVEKLTKEIAANAKASGSSANISANVSANVSAAISGEAIKNNDNQMEKDINLLDNNRDKEAEEHFEPDDEEFSESENTSSEVDSEFSGSKSFSKSSSKETKEDDKKENIMKGVKENRVDVENNNEKSDDESESEKSNSSSSSTTTSSSSSNDSNNSSASDK